MLSSYVFLVCWFPCCCSLASSPFSEQCHLYFASVLLRAGARYNRRWQNTEQKGNQTETGGQRARVPTFSCQSGFQDLFRRKRRSRRKRGSDWAFENIMENIMENLMECFREACCPSQCLASFPFLNISGFFLLLILEHT